MCKNHHAGPNTVLRYDIRNGNQSLSRVPRKLDYGQCRRCPVSLSACRASFFGALFPMASVVRGMDVG